MDKKFVPRAVASRQPRRTSLKAKTSTVTAASFSTRRWKKLDVASGPLSAGSTEVPQASSSVSFSLPPEAEAVERKQVDLAWLATPPLERQPPQDEVLKLPFELFYHVITLLKPIERVALALTNRRLATVVQLWASGKPARAPSHAQQPLLLHGPTSPLYRLVVPDGTAQTLVSFPHFASNFALTTTEVQLLQRTEHRDAPKVLACSNCLSFSHTASTGYHISVPPLVNLTKLRKKMMRNPKVRWLLQEEEPAITRVCIWFKTCRVDVSFSTRLCLVKNVKQTHMYIGVRSAWGQSTILYRSRDYIGRHRNNSNRGWQKIRSLMDRRLDRQSYSTPHTLEVSHIALIKYKRIPEQRVKRLGF